MNQYNKSNKSIEDNFLNRMIMLQKYNTEYSNTPNSFVSLANTTTKTKLLKLKKILHDKNEYLQQRRYKKQQKNIKHLKNNYKLYLHETLSTVNHLIATQHLCSLLELIIRKQFREVFNIWQQQKQPYIQSKGSLTKQNQKPTNMQIQVKHNYNNHKQKLKCTTFTRAVTQILHQNTFQLINSCFSQLKSAKQSSKNASTLDSFHYNLENLRILQFPTKSPPRQQSLNLQQNSINCQILDLSLIQSKSTIITQKNIQKLQLLQKLNTLDLQYQKMINHYQIIKQDLYTSLQITNYKPIPSIYYQQSQQLSNKQSLNYSKDNNINIQTLFPQQKQLSPHETITELMHKNQSLQQQIYEIQSTVQVLLQMATHQININPDLLTILKEVKDILTPNPLGLSFNIG